MAVKEFNCNKLKRTFWPFTLKDKVDENGNVVLSQEEAEKKIKKLGGYEKLYRIKFEADYLAKLAYEGAERRYGSPLSPELKERIKFELHIMKTMGFPGYFLIVQDFINAARNIHAIEYRTVKLLKFRNFRRAHSRF